MQTEKTTGVTEQLHGFEDFVHTTMQDWKVPGLAVAIIKDDQVVFSQGFGQRDVENSLPVTPQTRFPIGSATKAFTTMALGLLADEGKIDWDTPVKNYLPTFKLYDSFSTERMTPRDLVTHRSGLPRHDLVWYGAPRTRKEIFDRLQYLEPSKDFRTVWQYQNIMFMVAGYLVGEIAGQSWEEFVQQRIFAPLEMTGTLLSTTAGQQTPDFSQPYKKEKEEVKQIPFYVEEWAVAPAGAIVSNISDMSQWVRLHLNKGMFGESRFISENQLIQMHAPQMVIGGQSQYPEMLSGSYGLGWFVVPYRGHTLVHHGGNIDGFSALVSFLPAEKIGMVVLTNMNGTPVPDILVYNICDRLLGLDEVPWSERNKQLFKVMEEGGEKSKEKSETVRVPNAPPSHPLSSYAGDYEHPGYGLLSVEQDGEGLKVTLNTISGPLKPYHYDIFEVELEKFDISMKLSFTTNVKGDIDGLSIPLEPTVKDIVFKRALRKEMTEKSFLLKFAGVYELAGLNINVIVALKGENALSLSAPGQPELELVPYKGTEFHVKDVSGISIEFKLDDETGDVTEATLTQPGAVFTLKRK